MKNIPCKSEKNNYEKYNENITFAQQGINSSHSNSYGCKYCFMFSTIKQYYPR